MEHSVITYEAFDATLVIHTPRELDHHNCTGLKRDTDLMLAENYINRIVFDFSRTEFMDSSGIGVLLSRYKEMNASRGSLCYYGAGGRIARILQMAGIPGLIRGYESRDEALGVRKQGQNGCETGERGSRKGAGE